MPERYDVFISYARRDRPEWVEALATNLQQRGFEVFLDDWEMGPGDVVVHELDRGMLRSKLGVLVLTKSYFERPFARSEYAALIHRAIEGRQRVIPVLVDDMEVPPLLETRVWVDFRGADGPEYDRKLEELVRALQGKKPKEPPARTGERVPPPQTRYRPEGAVRRTLRIGLERVALLAEDEEEGGHEPKPVEHALKEKIYELGRARSRRFPSEEVPVRRGAAEAVAAEASLHEASLAVGAALTKTFLEGAAGNALREAVRKATSLNASLDLAMEIVDDELRALPWETLRIPEPGGAPGEPLSLHPRVHLYRAATSDGSTPAIAIPGPLRILVAIGSPETGGGELLDYEKELGRILDAVEPARKEGKTKAHVQILHRGSVKAILEALTAERYHVLHLSCHAGPGVLILETDEGEEDTVTADRFWKEALPENRGVPLVVLAGCATALDVRKERSHAAGDGDRQKGEEALPGLAAELLDHGIPTVLAMQAPVSDAYATDLTARLYGALATHRDPAPLAALARARRDAENDRAKLDPKKPEFKLAEWATPALYLRGTPQLLYDPAAPDEEIQEPPEARFAHGVVVRKVGDFVGRRREERLILKTLRGDRHAGALIRGIGGVGKSTLAAEVLTHLMADHHLVVSTYGETDPEKILEEIGKNLLAVTHAAGVPENHPLRHVFLKLRRPDEEWADRLDLLQGTVLPQFPIVLLLDNFETNLADPEKPGGDHTVKNEALATFLASWLQTPGKSRLFVTCRYPFTLPEEAHRHLEPHHLGPLSPAETRKLLWRLPALEALSPKDRRHAYEAVGGHPRALEYLDALLRGGKARFTNVERRLEKALKKKGVKNPGAWIPDQIGADLDKALAETVTLASADVLLKDLLELLDPTPLARQLLIGASVYRVPVDPIALAWQVGKEIEPEPDPEGEAIRKRVNERAQEVKEQGEDPTRENLGLTDAEWQAYDEAIQRSLTPPIETPEGITEAHHLLERLGLLSRIPTGEATLYQVHRWTASALGKDTAPETLQTAHLHAARFWRWRVDKVPQSPQADVDQLLEARHHHHAAGDIEQAVKVTEWICNQLYTWGAYGREEQLCREVLEWVPDRSRDAAVFLHLLGIVAQKRGSYEEALEWYRKSLAVNEELNNRAGLAASYHQLGMVAQQQGSYEEALDWYRKSLAIQEELGNRAGMAYSYGQLGNVSYARGTYEEALEWYQECLAISMDLGDRRSAASAYHQLGIVAQERGSYEEALDWYRRSLAIEEGLGNRAGMASSYHQLGRVAQERGSYEEALDWYRKSLAIKEELGNRAGMANSYHQLGIVAQKHGSYEEALNWYRKSLAIKEDLGNRAGMASSYHQLGRVAEDRGSYEEALEWYGKSLAIHEELSDRAGMASSYHQLGMVAQERGSYEEALEWYHKSLAILEDLGNRSEMASSLSQIGVLLTETGRPEEAVPWNLRSLSIRQQIGVPEVRIDLHWLGRQREALGEKRFGEILREHLDEESAANVLRMLDERKEQE